MVALDWDAARATHWVKWNGGPVARIWRLILMPTAGQRPGGRIARDAAETSGWQPSRGCRVCTAARLQTIRPQTGSQATWSQRSFARRWNSANWNARPWWNVGRPRFSPVKRDGLDQTSIHAILDDGGGHLWFATGNGLRAATARVRAMRCKGRLLSLDGSLALRTGCAAGDSDQQSSVGVALGRRTLVVCHVQGNCGRTRRTFR